MASTTDPLTQYYQGISADMASSNPGSYALGNLAQQYAPTLAASNLQAAGINQQLGLLEPETNLANAYSESMAGNQLAGLGLTNEQLGIQGTGLAQRGQLENTQNALEKREFGIQQQQYPEEYGQAALNYMTNQQGLQGSLASQGALNTQGSKRQQANLLQNYQWQKADIGRNQQLSNLQQQGTLAGQKYTQEQLANAQKNLGLVAQRNGLSQDQVLNQLNYGLQQTGLGEQSNAAQLLSELGNVYAGEATGLEGALSQAFMAGGINPFAGG